MAEYLRGLNAKPEYPLTYSDWLEDEARRLGVKSPFRRFFDAVNLSFTPSDHGDTIPPRAIGFLMP